MTPFTRNAKNKDLLDRLAAGDTLSQRLPVNQLWLTYFSFPEGRRVGIGAIRALEKKGLVTVVTVGTERRVLLCSGNAEKE